MLKESPTRRRSQPTSMGMPCGVDRTTGEFGIRPHDHRILSGKVINSALMTWPWEWSVQYSWYTHENSRLVIISRSRYPHASRGTKTSFPRTNERCGFSCFCQVHWKLIKRTTVSLTDRDNPSPDTYSTILHQRQTHGLGITCTPTWLYSPWPLIRTSDIDKVACVNCTAILSIGYKDPSLSRLAIYSVLNDI